MFHINHVVPRSKGGATEEGNLALQCPSWSLHKSNKVTATDSLTGQTVALFHPLQQRWGEHFELDAAGRCRGITPVGRATVDALRMNDSMPLIARSIQIRANLLLPSPR